MLGFGCEQFSVSVSPSSEDFCLGLGLGAPGTGPCSSASSQPLRLSALRQVTEEGGNEITPRS